MKPKDFFGNPVRDELTFELVLSSCANDLGGSDDRKPGGRIEWRQAKRKAKKIAGR